VTSGRRKWLVAGLTGAGMTLTPWIGFLAPHATVYLMLFALGAGVVTPLVLLRSPIERVAGAGLSLIGLLPALFLSEVLAHLTFGGCLQ
jgi:hypothetical protein